MKKAILVSFCLTILLVAVSCVISDKMSRETLYNTNFNNGTQKVQENSNNDSLQQENAYSTGNELEILSVDYSNINNLSQSYFEVIINEKPFLLMGEEMLIDNYKSPYLQKYLTQCDDVQYTVLDMDGDGENEVLISGWTGDILVLHEENGNIYGFDFTFREMYNVKTDGSYYWNTNQGNTYGCSKLSFENGTCSSIELCRTELSDDGIAMFFVKDVSVAKEEYDSLTESLSGADSLTWYKLNIFPKQIADEG